MVRRLACRLLGHRDMPARIGGWVRAWRCERCGRLDPNGAEALVPGVNPPMVGP